MIAHTETVSPSDAVSVCMTTPERKPLSELDPSAVEQYAETFLARRDFYPRQTDSGSYFVVEKPLHTGAVMAHLRGIMTIGAYALSAENQAKWLCFDADSPERWQQLTELAQELSHQSITPYLEASRRGGHLWLFTAPTPAPDIRRFGRQILSEHGISDVELYPKQDKLTTGPGSLVRLPLGVHRITGKRYHFITVDGFPLAPTVREQISLLAHPTRVPQEFMSDVLARAPIPRELSPTPVFTPREVAGASVSERIKSSTSVHSFVSQYVELDPQGKGFCPFHDDQHKSFQVNDERNFWSCYAGCGGGSVIDFWMKWRQTHRQDNSFTATVTELAKMLLK